MTETIEDIFNDFMVLKALIEVLETDQNDLIEQAKALDYKSMTDEQKHYVIYLGSRQK